MAERLKKLGKQLLEMWNKFTKKQKTLIISAVCVVILALILLVFLMNRVDYTHLTTGKDLKEVKQVTELLDSNNIPNKFNRETLEIKVDSKKIDKAVLLLTDEHLAPDELTLPDVINNGIDTTNADRKVKNNIYYQNEIEKKINGIEGVEDSAVYYKFDSDETSILTEDKNTPASVMLTVNDDFKKKSANTIAEIVATAIGNEDAKKIRISDQNGNLLYNGGEEDLYSGTATDREDYKQKLQNTIANNLYTICVKYGDFNDAEIVPNLTLNNDKVTQLYTEYSAPEGMDQGLYSYSNTTKSTSTNGGDASGAPGTSSNDGTSYETANPSSSESKTDSQEYKYLPNERVTNTEYEVGAVIPEKSRVSIVLTKNTDITQDQLKKSGALKGTTFDAYVLAHNGTKPLQVDNQMYALVSNATGIPTNNITITAVERTNFIPKEKAAINWTNLLMIALAVLIVGLLLFVVFKGVKPVEVTELEPELSVEQLLATTKENQTIEDIEFNEVSEVRRMIEKFVDEKPEAVAQLLRNWFNEDWE